MNYVPLPIDMIELGRPLPVDVWDSAGKLLLRQGQPLRSEQHKEMLLAHQACLTESDARAWQKSFERMIHRLLQDGADVATLAHARLPAEILETDYVLGNQVLGGWLDLQEMLRGLLYQGGAAINPLQRLASIENRALELLERDPDESLFILFQALADPALGYCATHALLVGVVCQLTVHKLALPSSVGPLLLRSALVMNIGMARIQDSLATQSTTPNEPQRRLIREHPQLSLDMLQRIGVLEVDQLDLVRWHHEHDDAGALTHNAVNRRLLRMADCFVAKMAPRKTRLALSALSAAGSLVLNARPDTAQLGSAMAGVLGFYPPGSYVQLINGEKAVVAARGARANQPHLVSIINPGGMPLSPYVYRDSANPHFAIRSPLNAERIKVKVSLEKVRKARLEHAARGPAK